jgi:tetratricopeptide (TPR) repeat protein
MIVRNEAPVIARCLATVASLVNRWVIVDTGSTDGTQEIITSTLRGLPGTLHERPWRDFAHNRNEAFDLAKEGSDYILIIDADEQLLVPEGFSWPRLSFDAYNLQAQYSGMTYDRRALVSTRRSWRWSGVLHEVLITSPDVAPYRLEWPRIKVSHDGARARNPKTYDSDVAILEKALRDEPGNSRYAFYLAQSYRDAGHLVEAREAYRHRVTMSGWAEEIFYALYQIGLLNEKLGASVSEIQGAYLAAFQARPSRAEPLNRLARFHRERGEYALAYLFARRAVELPRPPDQLFIEDDVYTWGNLDELGVSAWWVGARKEGRDAIEKLLTSSLLPLSQRPRVESNLRYYVDQPYSDPEAVSAECQPPDTPHSLRESGAARGRSNAAEDRTETR